jgi:hypothetical protein
MTDVMTDTITRRFGARDDVITTVTLDYFDGAQMLGYGCGFIDGRRVGRDEEREATSLAWGVSAEVLKHPRHAEAVAAREVDNKACGRNCGDRCSRCVRRAQALRNWEIYKSPDFPGGRVDPW